MPTGEEDRLSLIRSTPQQQAGAREDKQGFGGP